VEKTPVKVSFSLLDSDGEGTDFWILESLDTEVLVCISAPNRSGWRSVDVRTNMFNGRDDLKFHLGLIEEGLKANGFQKNNDREFWKWEMITNPFGSVYARVRLRHNRQEEEE
tara:strand:- start:670 stop:1008 length:339 start_codon:yes stop_codon:yes gene_type:complete